MARLYDSDQDDSADDMDQDLPAAGAVGAADVQLGLSVDGANTHAAACTSTADAEAAIGTGAAAPSDVLAEPRTDTAMLSSQEQTAPNTVLQAVALAPNPSSSTAEAEGARPPPTASAQHATEHEYTSGVIPVLLQADNMNMLPNSICHVVKAFHSSVH